MHGLKYTYSSHCVCSMFLNEQWHDCIALCTGTSQDMGVSAW